MGRGSLLYSYAVTFKEGQTDKEVKMVSNLCEEFMPHDMVKVGSILWGFGQQAGD